MCNATAAWVVGGGGVHGGLCLSDVVCISAGLSDLISFSPCHLAWADKHSSFPGETSAAPEERGGNG